MLAFASILVAAAPAFAQPVTIEQAREEYLDGEFDAALARLSIMAEGEGLDRAALVELLELRALSAFGLGREQAMETATAQLAALAPDRRMGDAVPPPVRESLARHVRSRGGPLRVEAEARLDAGMGTVVIEAEARNQPAGLIRAVRIIALTESDEPPLVSEDGPLRVPAVPGATVRYRAELVSLGGAVVATAGSESAPRTLTVPIGASTLPAGREGADAAVLSPNEEDDDGPSPWIFIGVGAAVLVAAGIILLAVYLTRDTQVSTPGVATAGLWE